MKRKLLSLALALVLCLGLAIPAFAAETLDGNQLSFGEWGDGPSLTLTGVAGMTKTPIDPTEIYDVEVGGSLVLEMTYPAGKGRTYRIWNSGFYLLYPPNPSDFADWENSDVLRDSWEPSGETGYFTESSGMTRYVYHFTAADMGQKNGYDKISYPYIYWYDDADGDGEADSGSEGSAYFGVRVVPAQVPTAGGFSDVPATAWYADPVVWAVENGITNGTGAAAFSPNRTCTEGEILTFLWRSQNEPAPAGAVTDTKFYAKAAQWAAEQGLTDNFSAGADCTRAMVVTYLWKLTGSPEVAVSDFTDVAADADYAQAVAWAVEKGITNGTGATTFSPNKTCTRGEIVTFLYRAFAD